MKQNANHMPTILVVDRDPDDCQFFEEAIMEVAPGTEVRFWDGEGSLLEVLEQVRPSLVFIEYRFPGERADDWVQQLKSEPVFHAVPVVMWSTGSMGPFQKEIFGNGVQLYMEKPWEIALWTERVKIAVELCLQSRPVFSRPSARVRSSVLSEADLTASWALDLQVA